MYLSGKHRVQYVVLETRSRFSMSGWTVTQRIYTIFPTVNLAFWLFPTETLNMCTSLPLLSGSQVIQSTLNSLKRLKNINHSRTSSGKECSMFQIGRVRKRKLGKCLFINFARNQLKSSKYLRWKWILKLLSLRPKQIEKFGNSFASVTCECEIYFSRSGSGIIFFLIISTSRSKLI